mmetsp:Transcript_44891/g.72248  ORF Transcript_44891/g.72248 Transcript_44891/m.72248 type:complete len:209 (+) Transcript_44891:2-628(+)
MTTAARPTFHPAVGGEDQGYFRMEAGTRQLSVKDMPGHTRLKMRKAQAGLKSREELKTELEDRERTTKEGKTDSAASTSTPLALGGGGATLQLGSGEAEKDADDIDAANVASDDDSSDDEDETAELMRELERIKKEREDDAARKANEDKARNEAEKKDAMLRGNPLLGGGAFGVKRRWDDDVVFRNQVSYVSFMGESQFAFMFRGDGR